MTTINFIKDDFKSQCLSWFTSAKCQSNILCNKSNYECKFCNKFFSSRQGRWSHLKICKEKIRKEI